MLPDKTVGKTEVIDVSERWIFVSTTFQQFRIITGTIYFKPKLDLDIILESLQSTLDNIICRFPDAIILLGGDFNARIGNLDNAPTDLLESTNLTKNRNSLDEFVSAEGKTLLNFTTTVLFA